MENLQKVTEKKLFKVYDEMGCETVLLTDDVNLAINTAYNYQAVLIDNITGTIINDYSC